MLLETTPFGIFYIVGMGSGLQVNVAWNRLVGASVVSLPFVCVAGPPLYKMLPVLYTIIFLCSPHLLLYHLLFSGP